MNLKRRDAAISKFSKDILQWDYLGLRNRSVMDDESSSTVALGAHLQFHSRGKKHVPSTTHNRSFSDFGSRVKSSLHKLTSMVGGRCQSWVIAPLISLMMLIVCQLNPRVDIECHCFLLGQEHPPLLLSLSPLQF